MVIKQMTVCLLFQRSP